MTQITTSFSVGTWKCPVQRAFTQHVLEKGRFLIQRGFPLVGLDQGTR